ncbi:MAG: hypothetical protein UY70_C0001G0018 [Candidatus Kaiserbacteria bacterium GW2011_GWB1_52_6]|uniref:Uncharacterized protein n=3 Tax=Candidatus Kaiseribacteriota TaxID=1752734 RepID=A0A0G1XJQ7_9BACT|nr:MAG: hypothetical protein UY67_C0007G0018 [Candidatus Kaiserbacteria bacterium GW2011_GWA2_52_12]KKW28182.1 MAG: hypothetical protein UY70_C0001G0018 [Candidatus Kaiserbacteria bacterium GW2011_GWB1_52_6]KKW31151.1 MAG: hypothetical protein UY74_C0022G0007 [Candidatus Kaiserbacteria bacterium GW2011_GWC2_52_8b]
MTDLVGRFTTYIIDPLILLVFSAGFLLFMWGLVQFLFNVESDTGRQDGRNHMLWGLAGMLVMISVEAIIHLLDNTFNLGVFTGPGVNSINNTNSQINFR